MIEQCFIPCSSKRLEVGNVGQPIILVSLSGGERSVPTPMSIKWVLNFQACLRFHCLLFKGDFKNTFEIIQSFWILIFKLLKFVSVSVFYKMKSLFFMIMS